jgi:hypothetical protein
MDDCECEMVDLRVSMKIIVRYEGSQTYLCDSLANARGLFQQFLPVSSGQHLQLINPIIGIIHVHIQFTILFLLSLFLILFIAIIVVTIVVITVIYKFFDVQVLSAIISAI